MVVSSANRSSLLRLQLSGFVYLSLARLKNEPSNLVRINMSPVVSLKMGCRRMAKNILKRVGALP
jgi:hypothetical protein